MKTFILGLSSVLLMLSSMTSFADRVVITGDPIMLEQRGDVYHVPTDYTLTGPYHFVRVGGERRVCYAETQPDLANLNVMLVHVDVNGRQVQWHCYEYDTTHFEIRS